MIPDRRILIYAEDMAGEDRVAGEDGAATTLDPPLAYRLTGGQWLALDGLVAVLAMIWVTFNVRLGHGFRFVMPDPQIAVLTMATTLPVAVRRIWPVPALAVVAVAIGVLTATGRAPSAADVSLGMVVYMAAIRLRRRDSLIALIATEIVVGSGLLAAAEARGQAVLLHSMIAAAVVWFVGDAVRERRRYLAGLAEQTWQRQRADVERNRLAIREERVRIARELHDVVAHSLSVVTIQAGVGRKVGAARPAEALRALSAVEQSSRDALDELRRILGLLRNDDEEPASPSLAPAPGIVDLGELAEMITAAGTPVRLSVTGEVTTPTPATALTVYRIVQEALTNVVRHAPGAEAHVQVRMSPSGVHIRVTDDGPGGSPDPDDPVAHHGIVGMRERAAAFDGILEAGPLPRGGFQVIAYLPASGPATGQVA
jgi:signal transduction histidine kinase